MQMNWETADGPKSGEVIHTENCVTCGEKIFWLRLPSGAIVAVNEKGEGHWNQWDVCRKMKVA